MSELRFLGMSMCAHTKGMGAHLNCMRTRTLSMRMHS